MTAGMAVLLMDGCDRGIAFSVQNLKFRSVGEPEGEGNLRGSREGFSDLLRINLSLLRRLIRTEALVQEVAQADTPMATEYALCYCKGQVSPQALEYVRKALTAAKPAMLLDSSYFLPWLLPASFRLFTDSSKTCDAAGFQLFFALAPASEFSAFYTRQLYTASSCGRR